MSLAAQIALAVTAPLAAAWPVRVPRDGSEREVPIATAVAFAVLLFAGPAVALVSQAGACGMYATRGGERPTGVLRGTAASLAALGAAALVLAALTSVPHPSGPPFTPGDLPAIGLAAAALVGVRVLAGERDDVAFTLTAGAGSIGLAPIAVLVADFSAALLPVLLLPLAALHLAGRQAMLSENRALHDVLTGLPNRALFQDRVDRALSAAQRDGTKPVVMLLDLDKFKEVNDTLGHHRGDELLKLVGPRIAGVLRSSDTVARLGGDEFAVLLPSAPDAEAGAEVGQKILQALERPFRVDDAELEVGASLGIACFPEHGEDVDMLMQRADMAMYVAKGTRSGHELYDATGTARTDPLAVVGDLRRGMSDGELGVLYQPKVDLRTGQVRGAEALVRWEHPLRGLVLPSSFVGHAEHTGLIRPLTMHVLGTALAQVAKWRRGGLDMTVAVNLSMRSLLDRSLIEDVERLLATWGVPAQALELELTESTIMADPQRAREILDALHGLGVGLSIDDFGTGYSSLGKLKSLPVDEIKIDRSFVVAMSHDRSDATIVRSTIDLARNLGLRVVAEGVEDRSACAELAALGCDLGQGYYFSRPLDGDALAAWASARELPAAA
ncbi:MAG TPA: EAL domain-containing protein [Solirubrobacteraceae bacterium]|nr:EAL domain-containing protein [Solirubrobacteraceae bacterium]